MAVSHLELLVEEPSMEAAIRLMLPRLIGNVSFQVYAYQCKQDLLKRLPSRLQGYSSWLPDDYRIVVVVDRDDDNCHELKSRLDQMASSAGLRPRSCIAGGHFQVVNRLAIEELESWYFGDWAAVKAAYPKVPQAIPKKAKYRDPDAVTGGTWEAFERVLQKYGYFQTGLRKIEAARAIVKHWDPDANRSHSFKVFRETLREMVA
ncbi:MAG: DUF4276 family protein [Planctomycetota bacterium]